MDSEVVKLECWIYGDNVGSIFHVKIPRSETVADLKKVIKEEIRRFRDVDAKDLELYSIPSDEWIEGKLAQWKPEGETKLNARQKLSTVLSPSEITQNNNEQFIIINPPPLGATEPRVAILDMTFNCWVRGQGLNNVFPVEISSTALVGYLKETIKSKTLPNFHDVAAHALALYKVSIPFDDRIEETAKDLILCHENLLQPWETTSHYFPEAPPHRHLHLVVEAPLRQRAYPPSSLSQHDVKTQRLKFLKDRQTEAPSSAAKFSAFAKRQATSSKTIYCNRPSNACEVIPPTLLHRAFGEFLDDCETLETTAVDNSLTEELHVAMSNIHNKELDRAKEIREILENKGLFFNVTQIGQGYTTDGDMSVGVHRYAIAEFKNEVCSTGAEPYYQAGLYYLEATRDHAAKLEGRPYIAFAAATWNTRPVIEPLSVVLPMHYHHLNTRLQKNVARHLGAFKKAIGTLKQYYEALVKQNHPASSPKQYDLLFPYPTDFTSLCDNMNRRFEYIAHIPHRLLFKGTLDDKKRIYIKFVRHYSKYAHLACASLGCAPTLHGFEVIPGGWFMVIMDDLEEDYIRFCDYTDIYGHPPTAELIDNITNALRQLHERGYVHGDVRETNILVSRVDKTKFVLVDFDWAGKIKEVRYPMNVNRTENLWRPDGAVDGALIMPEHDMAMLHDIERRYDRVG
ncbi:hypothetical protein L210DRAFT_3571233 [Boletus edulis BED1]|uniref:Protein kinase domain-containing protein n=1 Tax=Boletus edulis BED1 TaxID=1328754 RepID=A0AAD4G6N7_BOLED|nr:hypothetical protein L210DRAFT_3571233 [Boletus edulis BED1]